MQPTNDLLALAGTIYGEIRGGTLEQKQNIVQVILNRHNTGSHPTIRDTCLAPLQFSCWNKTDVNYQQILNADTHDPEVWKACLDVATAALNGQNVDRVQGARNYYAVSSQNNPPWWSKVRTARVVLNDGASIFLTGC